MYSIKAQRDCKQAEKNGCCLRGERRKSQVRIKKKSKHKLCRIEGIIKILMGKTDWLLKLSK